MKKNYIAPEFEKITIDTLDVMTASGGISLGIWDGGEDDGMSIGSGDFTFQ